MRPSLTAISVSGMISPDCTQTQVPLRITRSAGLRPMATSIRARARRISGEVESFIMGSLGEHQIGERGADEQRRQGQQPGNPGLLLPECISRAEQAGRQQDPK